MRIYMDVAILRIFVDISNGISGYQISLSVETLINSSFLIYNIWMALSFFLEQPSELRKPSKPSIIRTLSLLGNSVCIMKIPSGRAS